MALETLTRRFSLAVFGVVSAISVAHGECARGSVCVFTEQKNNSIDVFAWNQTGREVTVTIAPMLINLGASESVPFTASLSPEEKKKVFGLYPLKIALDWQYEFNFQWNWGGLHSQHDDTYLYRLPFKIGKKVSIIQGYHGTFSHNGRYAYGTDFGVPEGTPVMAARNGEVIIAIDEFSTGGPDPKYENKCNMVKVLHSDGTIGLYAHLKEHGVLVSDGQKVVAGQLIGFSGNTGFSDRPHLHFDVHRRTDGFSGIETIPTRFHAKDFNAGELKQGKNYTVTD